jgi:hypothetical protein
LMCTTNCLGSTFLMQSLADNNQKCFHRDWHDQNIINCGARLSSKTFTTKYHLYLTFCSP